MNDTRRSVVGGLAHTDRWQTEVDEVATVNQYEPTGKPLSCVVAFEGLLSYIQLQQECKPTMEIARTQISRVFVADSKVGKDSWCSNAQDIKVCVAMKVKWKNMIWKETASAGKSPALTGTVGMIFISKLSYILCILQSV